MPTLSSLRNEALLRLGDLDNIVWGNAEIDRYIKEGYNQLCLRSEILWAEEYLDDVADQGVYSLPSHFYRMDRVVWNSRKVYPVRRNRLELMDARFETTTGDVDYYSLDGDGIMNMRKFPVPSSSRALTDTDGFGIPRSLADLETDTSTSFGIPRRMSAELSPPETDREWGIPRKTISKEASNTRIEFSKRPDELSGHDNTFDLPDQYVTYVRHFAMGKALERESAGQDLQLSKHYLQRYEVGVSRVIRRRKKNASRPLRQFGGVRRRIDRGPQWPWNFPPVGA